jgi:hypothetical protein
MQNLISINSGENIFENPKEKEYITRVS